MLQFLLGASTWAFRSGEFAFARGWPLWVLWASLLLGLIAIAFTLARRQLGWWRASVLGLLQLAFLALVLVLLWRPVLRVEQIRERQNAVAVLVDDSGSMNVADSEKTPTRRAQAVAALQGGVLKEIGAHSDLRLFSFSDHANPVDSLQDLQGGAGATRIGEALDTVTQLAGSVPLAAVVLVSDGADTADSLDEAEIAKLAAAGIPVHTVGVGPEKPKNDLEIAQLQVPSSAMAGSTVRATVSIRHQDQKTGRLRLYDAGRLLAAQDVQFTDAAGLATVAMEFPAGDAGVRDLRVAIDAAPGETETRVANNERHAVMQVDGRRRTVLYIEGEPRWEYKFIRRAVEGDRVIRLASAVRATPNRYYRQGLNSGDELETGFPATIAELYGYDAVMLGSLEAAALSEDQQLAEGFRRQARRLVADACRPRWPGRWRLEPRRHRAAAAGEIAWRIRTQLRCAQEPGTAHSLRARIRGGSARARRSREREGVEGIAAPHRLPGTGPTAPWCRGAARDHYGRQGFTAAGHAALRPRFHLAARHRHHLALADAAAEEDQRHETFWKQLLYTLAAPAPDRISLQPERSVYEDGNAVTLEAEVLDESFQPAKDPALTITASAPSGAVVPGARRAFGSQRWPLHRGGGCTRARALPGTPQRHRWRQDAG